MIGSTSTSLYIRDTYTFIYHTQAQFKYHFRLLFSLFTWWQTVPWWYSVSRIVYAIERDYYWVRR